MGGRFTSHDIASCEGGREGRRGDRKTEKERERKGAAAVNSSSQAVLLLSPDFISALTFIQL